MDNSFNTFFKSLLEQSGLSLSSDLSVDQIRFIISKINEYFYTNYDGIGNTDTLGSNYEYLSKFHKFWEKNNKKILNPNIDDKQCEKSAEVLHQVYVKYGRNVFYELYDTFSLKPEEICKIRYFSAIQDFRGSRDFEKLFNIYKSNPSIFDKSNVYENPVRFLESIKITNLSQIEKRKKFASVASKILIDAGIEPFNLFDHFGKDIFELRKFLLANQGSGFGNKKTDMFLRDMVLLGVWKNPKNFDKIDVASDMNTVKVALRSRILQTEIPLVSSFIDIFCHQYTLIDKMNALAWREVWEKWRIKYPNECIESPCLIDYFVYRIIGREFCKESLYVFKCESENHTFKWHTAQNKKCQICLTKGIKNKASILDKILPCTDEDGNIAIENSEYVTGENAILCGIKECPFTVVCNPKDSSFVKLNPPKSISILGQTGWNSARTRKGEGGGGLMS